MGIAGNGIALATPLSNIQTVSVNQIKANELHVFKLQPRFNVWGFTGDKTLAETQVLFPLKGDNNKVLYAIGEGNYTKNDSSWMAGLGFGYRQIVEGKILGGYLIADYVNTPQNDFVVANPGIEILGFHDVWDFNVNGYIPLEKEKKLGKEGWAGDDFGDYSFGRATGHEFYDHKMQEFEEAGAGFDVEVGRTIPGFEKAKVYLGGYHFDSRESGSINGIETRFTYDLNKYTTLELENNYDNLHKNKFIVGVRFGLGGYSQEEKQQFGLSTRLLDPIEHDHVVATHRAVIGEAFIDKGEQQEHDNIWYFKSGNAIGDVQTGSGTAEDPLVNFTQANYDVVYAHKDTGILDPHPLMYFAPGQYSFSEFASRSISNRFALDNGWGMYGRSSDYNARANGNERAEFSGGLDMDYDTGAGTDATTLDSVRIYNNVGGTDVPGGRNNATLYIENADNVIFNNVYIKNEVTSSLQYFFVDAIYADNSTLNFNGGTNAVDSKATNNYTPAGSETAIVYVYGIDFKNNSTLNFNSGTNTITSFASANANTTGAYIYGIVSENNLTLNFNGGTNAINSSSLLQRASVYGVYANTSSILNFNNGNNTIYSSAVSFVFNVFLDNSVLNFNGGTNTVTSSSSNSSNSVTNDVYGIYAFMGSTLNFNGGTNAITSSSSNVNCFTRLYGIYAFMGSTLNFNGGTNAITSSDTNSNSVDEIYGIYIYESTLNFKNNENPINITITQSGGTAPQNTIGIYTNDLDNSSINYWDGNQLVKVTSSNINDILNYATFTKTAQNSGSTADYKVNIANNFTLDWQ